MPSTNQPRLTRINSPPRVVYTACIWTITTLILSVPPARFAASTRRAHAACGDVAELQTSLDELLARADILSIHTPLTDETRGLLGADALAKAKEYETYAYDGDDKSEKNETCFTHLSVSMGLCWLICPVHEIFPDMTVYKEQGGVKNQGN